MSNKYIKEAAESYSSQLLPKTFEEFSLLPQSEASRVPMAHIQKLREQHSSTSPKRESDFVKNPIKW